jgi:hypothetical protein
VHPVGANITAFKETIYDKFAKLDGKVVGESIWMEAQFLPLVSSSLASSGKAAHVT